MERRTLLKAFALGFLLVPRAFTKTLDEKQTNKKRIKLIYNVELPYKDATRLWIPVPMNTSYQRLMDIEVSGNASKIWLTRESVYDTPILYMEFQNSSDKKIAEIAFYVEIWDRDKIKWESLPTKNGKIPQDVALYLKPTRHIQTDGIVKEYAEKNNKKGKKRLGQGQGHIQLGCGKHL